MAGWTTLVQPETLAIGLGRGDLAIVDCRFSLLDAAAGEQAYLTSHLPGAVYAHLERDLSDMHRHGEGRHPWPSADAFTERLSRWGIDPRTQVVAYDDGDGAHAARLWFLLRVLGHGKAAVLDGGWSRWTALGLPVTSAPSAPARRAYAGSFDPARVCDADAVQAHLAGGGVLLDARAAPRFRGEQEPLDRIAGHVPGASNRPYADNLANGQFKSAMQLAAEFRALLGDRPGSDVVAMCGSGVTACHNLLAMERAGLKGGRLYAGSWSGWISDPSRPIATGA
ncbi:MAG: sulfurtransferase [Xanthomonadales bacterium]|nr:sulfurtransferase [Xanthomonadales bacterium]